MSEEELNEAIEYNLEYMEAMQSEEIFGGDYTSQVELKYFKKSINRLQQENQKYKEVIDKAIEKLEEGITFCKNDSQGIHDKCNIAIKREQNILDILKEAK